MRTQAFLTYKLPLAAVAAAALLAGCGGGNDGPAAAANAEVQTVPGSGVPVAATVSAAGAIDFILSLLPRGENEEPVALGDAVLGTSETEEPRPL
jgi:hypothetical protein